MHAVGITFLGIGSLGINLPGLIVQLVGFAILLVVMKAVAYKPILKAMDQRSQRIREGLDAAEKMKLQASQSDVEVQKRLEQARQEGQGLISQAQEVANRLQADARQQAQAEGESLLARARSEIAMERDEAIAQIRREFADLTIAAAEKVIGQSLDKKAHERLIEEVLTQSSFEGQQKQ